jgi:exonuclease III
MDMRFGAWNVRGLYGAGSLVTISKKLLKYKLDLVGVQEVRWEDGGTEPSGEYTSYQQLRRLSLLVIGCHT